LLDVIGAETVVVGHNLHTAFAALKLSHAHFLDVGLLFRPLSSFFVMTLKDLVSVVFGPKFFPKTAPGFFSPLSFLPPLQPTHTYTYNREC
jgi:hypothetical protein